MPSFTQESDPSPSPRREQPVSTVSSLSIRLLGAFEVSLGGRPLSRLRSHKGEWLLALLTLNAGRGVARTRLAAMLWPDSDESQALASLRQSLADLRKALGEEGHRLISHGTRGLFLESTGAEVDLTAFDAAIYKGNRESLEQAITLYRGSLLEGCHEEWVWGERAAREQSYLCALETLAEEAMTRGDFTEASSLWQRTVAKDPFRESAARGWMTALARQGNHAAAIQVYRDLRLLLSKELRTEPNAQTQALHLSLRAEAQQPGAAQAGETNKAPLFTPPERHLPRPLTELIGRERETATVSALLFQSRLVTLTGPGGVGKTRLAIRVAEEWTEAGLEGAWFVDLASLTDAALVVPTVAAVLSVRAEPGRALSDTLTAALKPRRLLLVLDNCEHLLETCAALAAGWLIDCPALRLLLTTRQALRVTGETRWAVPSLSVPDREEDQPLETTVYFDAVRLFVERASSVLPGFTLTPANARAVVQICRRLDGIPLALELAATRVRMLSPDQIATRLDDRFHLLNQGSRAVLPRHQTLRAVVDWSYGLLSAPERRMLMRLSVFAGGWTLEAAETVCADSRLASAGQKGDVLDLLTELEEKSLVLAEASDRPEPRYRLLETIRQYAREGWNDSGQAVQTARRHREWALALAEAAETHCRGAEAGAWGKRLEAEHDNLRAALENCQNDDTEEGAQTGLRLAGALWRFWMDRGHFREGLNRLTLALAQAGDAAPKAVRSKALNGAAALAWHQGDILSARRCMEEALILARHLGEPGSLDSCLHNLGNVLYSQREYAAARSFWEESLAIRRRAGSQALVAASLNNLGYLAYNEGEVSQARALHTEALALAMAQKNSHGQQASLVGLGVITQLQGDLRGARSHFEQSLALAQEMGDTDAIAGVLLDLGRVAQSEGNYDQAEATLRTGLEIARDTGLTPRVLDALDGLSGLALSCDLAWRAACLSGAVQAQRLSLSLPRMLAFQTRCEAHLEQTQAILGTEAYADAWAKGQYFTMNQAVDFALETTMKER